MRLRFNLKWLEFLIPTRKNILLFPTLTNKSNQPNLNNNINHNDIDNNNNEINDNNNDKENNFKFNYKNSNKISIKEKINSVFPVWIGLRMQLIFWVLCCVLISLAVACGVMYYKSELTVRELTLEKLQMMASFKSSQLASTVDIMTDSVRLITYKSTIRTALFAHTISSYSSDDTSFEDQVRGVLQTYLSSNDNSVQAVVYDEELNVFVNATSQYATHGVVDVLPDSLFPLAPGNMIPVVLEDNDGMILGPVPKSGDTILAGNKYSVTKRVSNNLYHESDASFYLSITLPIFNTSSTYNQAIGRKSGILGYLSVSFEATSLLSTSSDQLGMGSSSRILLAEPVGVIENRTDYFIFLEQKRFVNTSSGDMHDGLVVSEPFETNKSFVQNAFNGGSGSYFKNNWPLSSGLAVGYAPVNVNYVQWASVISTDRHNLLSPIRELRDTALLVAFCLGFGVSVATFLIAHMSIKPLIRLRDAIARTRFMGDDDTTLYYKDDGIDDKNSISSSFNHDICSINIKKNTYDSNESNHTTINHSQSTKESDKDIEKERKGGNIDNNEKIDHRYQKEENDEDEEMKSDSFSKNDTNKEEISFPWKIPKNSNSDDRSIRNFHKLPTRLKNNRGLGSGSRSRSRNISKLQNNDTSIDKNIDECNFFGYRYKNTCSNKSFAVKKCVAKLFGIKLINSDDQESGGLQYFLKHNEKPKFVRHEITELTVTFHNMIEALQQQYGTLEQQVYRRTRALQEAKMQAEEARILAENANEAKTTFIANISHEIRTPLNGILGMTAVLMEDPTINSPTKTSLSLIAKSGELLLNLVNDLLTFSKNQLGQVALDEREFNMYDLTNQIFPMFLKQANISKIHLSIFTKPNIFPYAKLYGDPNRLLQIVINLVSNALKFTPKDGSVTVNVVCKRMPSNYEKIKENNALNLVGNGEDNDYSLYEKRYYDKNIGFNNRYSDGKRENFIKLSASGHVDAYGIEGPTGTDLSYNTSDSRSFSSHRQKVFSFIQNNKFVSYFNSSPHNSNQNFNHSSSPSIKFGRRRRTTDSDIILPNKHEKTSKKYHQGYDTNNLDENYDIVDNINHKSILGLDKSSRSNPTINLFHNSQPELFERNTRTTDIAVPYNGLFSYRKNISPGFQKTDLRINTDSDIKLSSPKDVHNRELSGNSNTINHEGSNSQVSPSISSRTIGIERKMSKALHHSLSFGSRRKGINKSSNDENRKSNSYSLEDGINIITTPFSIKSDDGQYERRGGEIKTESVNEANERLNMILEGHNDVKNGNNDFSKYNGLKGKENEKIGLNTGTPKYDDDFYIKSKINDKIIAESFIHDKIRDNDHVVKSESENYINALASCGPNDMVSQDGDIIHPGEDCLLVIEVQDTGVGIAKNLQSRIFEAFVQGDLSLSKKYSGTGLGLAISRQLARMMHGDISLVSAPTEGSTFTLSVPLKFLGKCENIKDDINDKNCISTEKVITESNEEFLQNGLDQNNFDENNGHKSGKVNVFKISEENEIKGEKNEKGMEKYNRTCNYNTNNLNKVGDVENKSKKDGVKNFGNKTYDDKIMDEKIKDNGESCSSKDLKLEDNRHSYIEEFNNDKISIRSSRSLVSLISLRDDIPPSRYRIIGYSDPYLMEIPDEENVKNKPEDEDKTVLSEEKAKDVNKKSKEQDEVKKQLEEKEIINDNIFNDKTKPVTDLIKNDSEKNKEIRILVAEDNIVNQQVIVRMLKLEHIDNVSIANDGNEALNIVSELRKNGFDEFDLVLMDIQMPELDGLQTSRLLRKNFKYKGPIIALTAFSDDSNVKECYEAGMNRFLSKPVRVGQLRDVLKSYLEKN